MNEFAYQFFVNDCDGDFCQGCMKHTMNESFRVQILFVSFVFCWLGERQQSLLTVMTFEDDVDTTTKLVLW